MFPVNTPMFLTRCGLVPKSVFIIILDCIVFHRVPAFYVSLGDGNLVADIRFEKKIIELKF